MNMDTSLLNATEQLEKKVKECGLDQKYVYQIMNDLVKVFVLKDISPFSNVEYNEYISNSSITLEDISDLIKQPDVYLLRRHMRNVISRYLCEFTKMKPLEVSDNNGFNYQLSKLGLVRDTNSKSIFIDYITLTLAVSSIMLFMALILKR